MRKKVNSVYLNFRIVNPESRQGLIDLELILTKLEWARNTYKLHLLYDEIEIFEVQIVIRSKYKVIFEIADLKASYFDRLNHFFENKSILFVAAARARSEPRTEASWVSLYRGTKGMEFYFSMLSFFAWK